MGKIRRSFKPHTDGSSRYTVRDLYRENLLEEIAESTKFRIVGFNPTKYNQFDIMPIEIVDDDFFRLNEDIYEHVLDPASEYKIPPEKLDIVLAKKEDDKYYRAVLLKKLWNDTYGIVAFIDAGNSCCVEINSLKNVNEEIMKYPILSYNVIIEDLFETSDLFTMSEFATLIGVVFNKNDLFSLEIGQPLADNMSPLTFEKGVKLTTQTSKSTYNLADIIRKLEKWEWEEYSNLTGTDEEVCAQGNYRSITRSLDSDVILYFLDFKEKIDRFTAIVTRVLPSEDKSCAELNITLLSLPHYKNYFRVLHGQLAKYTENITKTKFYPALQENVLFKLNRTGEDEDYENKIRGVDMWLRGIRVEKDVIYLFDVDETIPFTYLDRSAYDMRRMHREFMMKVPILTITVRPTFQGETLSVDEAKGIFDVGKRYSFEITKKVDNKIFQVSFDGTNEQDNLNLTDFLQT